MISDLLRDVLACPADKAPVHIDDARALVICPVCDRAYPIRDGIPVMLISEATSAT
jgi:uncharacterized protein